MAEHESGEPKFRWNPNERPSARTAIEREDHYDHWIDTHDDPEEPWFSSDEERRELFMRRYRRPSPPDMPAIRSVRDHHRRTDPNTWSNAA